jgi:thiol-disulfide isomerase/thioredoxin
LYDGEDEKVSRRYGPVATPHVFIFDKERKLRYVGRIDNGEKIGTATQHDARNALEALLAGKPVRLETTKTFGCSIKWAEKREYVKKDLENLAKKPVSLKMIDEAAVKGISRNDSTKLRVVNVWATWCAPCLAELPDLVLIEQMYRERGFEVITISADDLERKDKVMEVLKEKHVSCQNYIFNRDDKDALSEAVDKEWQGAFPYTLVIAPGGKIIHRQMGEIDVLKLKKAIVGYLGRYFFGPIK